MTTPRIGTKQARVIAEHIGYGLNVLLDVAGAILIAIADPSGGLGVLAASGVFLLLAGWDLNEWRTAAMKTDAKELA